LFMAILNPARVTPGSHPPVSAHPHPSDFGNSTMRPACSGSPENSSCGTRTGHERPGMHDPPRRTRTLPECGTRGIIVRRPCVIMLVIPVRDPLHALRACRKASAFGAKLPPGSELENHVPRKRITLPLRPVHHRIGGEVFATSARIGIIAAV